MVCTTLMTKKGKVEEIFIKEAPIEAVIYSLIGKYEWFKIMDVEGVHVETKSNNDQYVSVNLEGMFFDRSQHVLFKDGYSLFRIFDYIKKEYSNHKIVGVEYKTHIVPARQN